MTHLVTDSCIKCNYTDCVNVCPMDCFHEGPGFLVIDSETHSSTRPFHHERIQ